MTEEEKKALDAERTRLRKLREEEEYFQNYVYKKVEFVKFGILSPKIIQKMSSAKVITPELYDSEGYPVDGGLMDTRMGVIDPGLRCKTCGQKLKDCPGHFGYIELARPVVHINFISEILDLLRCTCKMCGRIILAEETIKKHKKELDTLESEFGLLARRSMIKEIIRKLKTAKKCPHCKATQGKIMLEKPSSFVEDEKKMNPIEVRARLEKIPDDDLRIFGFDPNSVRPEWMILTIMPIPPVTIRPSITLESGERSEDDLTHKLGDIVRINQRLFENINAGAPEIIIEDLWDLLQYHVTTFFDNNVAQIPPARHRSGQPLKTLSGRIKSKEGRIRHNLAGRRTNFSARSVISPDPNLELNEVGVPIRMAMKLTIPERVTDWNKDYLIEYIKRGPKVYPGANYVLTPAGRKKRITDETRDEILAELDTQYIVERHLIDGDIALFNRQPSLHRMSMMCHKIRVLPYQTLRINPCVGKPYNADFDGDEMNLHIPQTEEARAEAQILMQVQTQLVSPRYGRAIIGAMQGAITGAYILTKFMKVERKEAIQMLNAIGVFDTSNLPNKEIINGNEIMSSILPVDFKFKGKTKKGEELLIQKGKIMSGFIDVNAIGDDGKGYMLRILHKTYGPDKTIDILGKIFRLGLESLLRNGFTASISDTDLTPEISKLVEDVLSKAEKDIEKFIKLFYAGDLEVIPGKDIEETLELRILERLNKARNEAGESVIKSMDKNIPLIVMANCGSRGNVINIAQMSACVGQQAMRGKRINLGYKERTLSCFQRNDLSPKSHGFIRNSFKSGLKPYEFFFAAMTGRDSLMDTALRTPKSGYLYRRLSNALQDLKVEYDGTVRDSSNHIIQFKYGDDGIDVSKSEKGKINVQRIIEDLE
ncbi:MAG: DNA-directed RNA polymerase subunit A' [Nanoarchaeota archaeon]|nr:DNA-directed RNA polymerase subunit A' [Nanoarchaeota archaeon]